MDTNTFNLIDSINREGIDNGLWGLYDFGKDGQMSKQFFGTLEDVRIKGKVLYLYVGADDWYNWVKPDEADMVLTLAEDNKLHIWHIY